LGLDLLDRLPLLAMKREPPKKMQSTSKEEKDKMKIVSLICIVFLPYSLFGQKTKIITNYFEVDGDTITQIDKNCIIEERYGVLKRKKKIRHGNYQRYDKMSRLIEEGEYEGGEKIGIWQYYKEKGLVLEMYDHDRGVEIEPIILVDRIFRYPYEYLEETIEGRVELKEGEVVLNIKFDEDCNLMKMELGKKSDAKFNQISLAGFKEYVRLKKKYNQEVEACVEKSKTFRVTFKG